MGGTTAKASLIRNGQYETTPEYEVGGGASGNRWMHGTGHPIRVPVIDLAEVSAGGGSHRLGRPGGRAARRPAERRRRSGSRLLRPRRHRADRHRLQPACSATSTRARCWRATCPSITRRPKPRSPSASPSRWASTCARRPRPSSTWSTTPWRRRSRSSPCSAATIRASSCWPPSAAPGPLHAAALAAELGIAEVLCPPIPGAFSALGLVGSDLKRDYVRTVYTTTATADPASAGGRLRRARGAGRRHARPRRRGAGAAAVRALRRCALRAPVLRARRCPSRRARSTPPRWPEIAEAFHDRHRATYGHDNRGEPVQLVSARLTAVGAIPPLLIRDKPAPAGTDAVKGSAPRVVPRDRRGRAPPSATARACRRGWRRRARR